MAALFISGVMTCGVQAQSVLLNWKLLGNDTPAAGLCSAELTLAPTDHTPAPDSEAFLYFNFGRKPAGDLALASEARVEHVNGDLFRLKLESSERTEGVLRLGIVSQGAVRSLTDAPAGFFVVTRGADGAEAVTPVAASLDLSALHDNERAIPQASVPRASDPPRAAPATAPPEPSAPLIPQPVRYEPLPGVVPLNNVPLVSGVEHAAAARLLSDAIVAAGGAAPGIGSEADPTGPAIRLGLGDVAIDGVAKRAGDEAYSLEIRPGSGVRITGTDPAGLYYGAQTLVALLANAPADPEKETGPALPGAVVHDAPHFAYRGLHLDVARNFQTPATVHKLLDLMAAYKLNRFHLHLTDDEGWRLAIRDLPELTGVGGRRGYSPGFREFLPPSFGSGPDASGAPGSGHYTREEFVGLLRHAAERHIEVIPEIDLPGHARAAIHAMRVRYERLVGEGDRTAAERFLLRRPDDTAEYESVQMWTDNVVDVRLDSTHRFVDHVVGDLADMYTEAGLRLKTLHLGGDELPSGCWGESADEERHTLFASFMDRCAETARAHGARSAGWEEVFLDRGHGSDRRRGASSEGLCYAWNNIWGWGREDAAYRLANAGADVVLCNATHLYFDLAYREGVSEPGYYWAGTTDTEEVFNFRPYTYFEGLTHDRLGNPVSEEDKQTKTRLTTVGRSHVIGMQGHLWGENLNSSDRVEYLAFPRVLALAERAWVGPHQRGDTADPPRTWPQFARQVDDRELPRLGGMFGGVGYRTPAATTHRPAGRADE